MPQIKKLGLGRVILLLEGLFFIPMFYWITYISPHAEPATLADWAFVPPSLIFWVILITMLPKLDRSR